MLVDQSLLNQAAVRMCSVRVLLQEFPFLLLLVAFQHCPEKYRRPACWNLESVYLGHGWKDSVISERNRLNCQNRLHLDSPLNSLGYSRLEFVVVVSRLSLRKNCWRNNGLARVPFLVQSVFYRDRVDQSNLLLLLCLLKKTKDYLFPSIDDVFCRLLTCARRMDASRINKRSRLCDSRVYRLRWLLLRRCDDCQQS